ncbi:hypothetical protein San01_47140 [Streptomyces angustmyceticus]|uniref:Uncharacterized protein n=1 Tax=Streptomyces angustmyceticus TaxID=285578 RepID=A0A5J4LDA5_9ACTN|nr:hypothetical protein San01_47140 [Streptomyces angustmyceticus]
MNAPGVARRAPRAGRRAFVKFRGAKGKCRIALRSGAAAAGVRRRGRAARAVGEGASVRGDSGIRGRAAGTDGPGTLPPGVRNPRAIVECVQLPDAEIGLPLACLPS